MTAVAEEINRSGRFLWVGNDLSLDLVNTTPVLDGRPADLLGSFTDLVDWLAEAGRLGASERAVLTRRVGRAAGGALLKDARAFRSRSRSRVSSATATPFSIATRWSSRCLNPARRSTRWKPCGTRASRARR